MNYSRRGFSHHSLGTADISHDFLGLDHKKGREIMRALGLFAAFIGLVGIAGGCKRARSPSEQPAADTKAELARFRFDCSNLISKGDGLVNDGKLNEAKLTYLNAKALLEGKQGLVLPKKEREDLLSQLAARLKSVETRGRYEDAIAAANEARKDGDKVGEMAALQWAYKNKPSAEVEARIKSLRSQVDMDRVARLGKVNTSEAIKVLKKLLEYDPGNFDAKSLLKGLERLANWQKALSEANRLYRKGSYEQALTKYGLLLPPDAFVKERIADCRYRIKVTEGEQLRRADKLYEAIKAYEEALRIRPERAAWISARQELCKREMQYREHLEAGDEALKKNDWNGALDEYSKARKIKDSEEIKTRISATKYRRIIPLGKAALENGDPKRAKKHFELALMLMDIDQPMMSSNADELMMSRNADELRRLIAKADRLIKESRTSE